MPRNRRLGPTANRRCELAHRSARAPLMLGKRSVFQINARRLCGGSFLSFICSCVARATTMVVTCAGYLLGTPQNRPQFCPDDIAEEADSDSVSGIGKRRLVPVAAADMLRQP